MKIQLLLPRIFVAQIFDQFLNVDQEGCNDRGAAGKLTFRSRAKAENHRMCLYSVVFVFIISMRMGRGWGVRGGGAKRYRRWGTFYVRKLHKCPSSPYQVCDFSLNFGDVKYVQYNDIKGTQTHANS